MRPLFHIDPSDRSDAILDRVASGGDFQLNRFRCGHSAVEHLHLEPVAVIVSGETDDLQFGELLRLIHAYDRNIDVIIVDASADMERLVELLRDGAWDVLSEAENLTKALTESLQQAQVQHSKRFAQVTGPLFGNPKFREEERLRYSSEHAIELPYPPISRRLPIRS